jgi:hypothetical protein
MSIAKINRQDIVLTNDERWIPGYEGFYSITKNGQVASYTYFKKHLLSSKCSKHRYASVMLGSNNRWYIHELILLTYVGQRPVNGVARHLNDNPRDNRLENLAWGTISDNVKDRKRNGHENYFRKYTYPYIKKCNICGKYFEVFNHRDLVQKVICSDDCKKLHYKNRGKYLFGKWKDNGFVFSDEHREKLSEAAKKRWANRP